MSSPGSDFLVTVSFGGIQMSRWPRAASQQKEAVRLPWRVGSAWPQAWGWAGSCASHSRPLDLLPPSTQSFPLCPAPGPALLGTPAMVTALLPQDPGGQSPRWRSIQARPNVFAGSSLPCDWSVFVSHSAFMLKICKLSFPTGTLCPSSSTGLEAETTARNVSAGPLLALTRSSAPWQSCVTSGGMAGQRIKASPNPEDPLTDEIRCDLHQTVV